MSVQWTEDGFCEQVRCEVSTRDGAKTELVGTVQLHEQFAPLRHRRSDDDGSELVTRIGYAPYTFRTDDGRTGLGIVEALDQLIDGRPAGMA